ncbi:Nitrogen permease regulator 2 [Bachmanniomyces sp. S44760]|nr:Nitrogen permease regulator 2 [Bachmanniomyces sp. S44760]
MIKAIFFAKFDTHEGPKVVHQVPSDSIVSSSPSTSPPMFHFPSISTYIIPRQAFCSRSITLSTKGYRILGHPMCLTSSKYDRNEYIFNFCLVLASFTEPSAYQSVVNKLAVLFHSLESQSEFLSKDPSPANTGKIYALCEILLEDLNNYCECMIPIDESNTLNIKLFPTYPPPPRVLAHHVPLSTVRLDTLTDSNWDLTMLLILPYINGVNSVKQIALLADADYQLVKKAIAHLLYYGCIIMLDIFTFGASYAPTAEMASFISDPEMQTECAKYVLLPVPGAIGRAAASRTTADVIPIGVGINVGFKPGKQKETNNDNAAADDVTAAAEKEAPNTPSTTTIDNPKLIDLYTSLKQGQTLKAWCLEHADEMSLLDIRRFITFGIIKGFLYRVHKYAFIQSSKPKNHINLNGGGDNKSTQRTTRQNDHGRTIQPRRQREETRKLEDEDEGEEQIHPPLPPAPPPFPSFTPPPISSTPASPPPSSPPPPLSSPIPTKYLDGTHCFDEICTQLLISEKELMASLKEMGMGGGGGGDVLVIQR